MDLFARSSDNILILGVGGAGSRVAGHGAANASGIDAPLHPQWAVAGSNAAELIASGIERKLLIPIADCPFAAQSVEKTLCEREDEFAAISESKAFILLVGAPGEPHTEILLPLIARKLRAVSDALICAITAPPLGLHGTAAGLPKAQSTDFLQAAVDLLVALPLDGLAQRFESATLTALQTEIEARMLHATETLSLALMSGFESRQINAAGLRQILCGAGGVQSAFASATGAGAPLRAAAAALSEISVNEIRGIAVAMVANRELSIAEAQSLAHLLAQQNSRPALISIGVRPGPEEEASCVLLLKEAGSRNVVPLAVATLRE